jgi:hypothetical protein
MGGDLLATSLQIYSYTFGFTNYNSSDSGTDAVTPRPNRGSKLPWQSRQCPNLEHSSTQWVSSWSSWLESLEAHWVHLIGLFVNQMEEIWSEGEVEILPRRFYILTTTIILVVRI